MTVLLKLLEIVLPILFQYLGAFLRNLQATKADDPAFLETIFLIVKGIQEAHPDATGDQKWEMGLDAVKVLAASKGKVIGTSLLNALIEVAVQRLKEQTSALP